MKITTIHNFLIYSCISLSGLALAQTDSTKVAGLEAIQAYKESLAGEERQAAEFLLLHLPEQDKKSLSLKLFKENLEQAFIARTSYPWTKELPQDLFFNDVLPHAVTSETRDPWRTKLRTMFHPKVVNCNTRLEAYSAVADNIKELTGVSYNTKRKKACQSPEESISQGMASCTGLSILMVDALRSVGLPARLAAIPLWGTKEGNHTWTEFHDGSSWRMAGYGKAVEKWDKGWEIARCAYSDPRQPIHGIFASSYKKTEIGFPTSWEWKSKDTPYCQAKFHPDGSLAQLTWNWQPDAFGGVDRTAHYIKLAGGRKTPLPKGQSCIAVRAYHSGTKTRLTTAVRIKQDGQIVFEGKTANETQDLNDYIRFVSDPGEFEVEHQTADGSWSNQTIKTSANKETAIKIELSAETHPTEEADKPLLTPEQNKQLLQWFKAGAKTPFPKADWPTINSPDEVADLKNEIWDIYRHAHSATVSSKELGPLPPILKKGGISPRFLTIGEHKMPFVLIRKEKSPPPPSGRALYICLHGGGQNRKSPSAHGWPVNTRDWQAQANLAASVYAGEGVFFVPRMADDRLGRWRHGFNQDAFDLVIEHGIREWKVDPNKVYIMGISQGGYATQLFGPFMPDRYAGICSMAGGIGANVPHENMLNIAIRSEIGENDRTFGRVDNCRKYHNSLEKLRKAYGSGYTHSLNVQKGKGHGLDYSIGPKWMIQHTRKAYPKTVIWNAQEFHGRRRPASYWIGLRGEKLEGSIQLKATLQDRNTIALESTHKQGEAWKGGSVSLMLNDSMLDLDQPIQIIHNGKKLAPQNVTRNVEALSRTLALRGDPDYAFPVLIDIDCL